MSDRSDAAIRLPHDGPDFVTREDVDDRNVLGLVRRYEQFATDVDQRLKDIVMLLGNMRADFVTERDRIDQLERDLVAHRDELAQQRKKTARKK